MVSGEAGSWKKYVKTTWAESHPNAPKLDDKLFASEAPPQVRRGGAHVACASANLGLRSSGALKQGQTRGPFLPCCPFWAPQGSAQTASGLGLPLRHPPASHSASA